MLPMIHTRAAVSAGAASPALQKQAETRRTSDYSPAGSLPHIAPRPPSSDKHRSAYTTLSKCEEEIRDAHEIERLERVIQQQEERLKIRLNMVTHRERKLQELGPKVTDVERKWVMSREEESFKKMLQENIVLAEQERQRDLELEAQRKMKAELKANEIEGQRQRAKMIEQIHEAEAIKREQRRLEEERAAARERNRIREQAELALDPLTRKRRKDLENQRAEMRRKQALEEEEEIALLERRVEEITAIHSVSDIRASRARRLEEDRKRAERILRTTAPLPSLPTPATPPALSASAPAGTIVPDLPAPVPSQAWIDKASMAPVPPTSSPPKRPSPREYESGLWQGIATLHSALLRGQEDIPSPLAVLFDMMSTADKAAMEELETELASIKQKSSVGIEQGGRPKSSVGAEEVQTEEHPSGKQRMSPIPCINMKYTGEGWGNIHIRTGEAFGLLFHDPSVSLPALRLVESAGCAADTPRKHVSALFSLPDVQHSPFVVTLAMAAGRDDIRLKPREHPPPPPARLPTPKTPSPPPAPQTPTPEPPSLPYLPPPVEFTRSTWSELSPSFPAPTLARGHVWATADHFIQAQKYAGTPHEAEIREAPSAEVALQWGEEALRPLRADWEKVRQGLMLEYLREKFSQNPACARALLATCDRPLVFAETDPTWGSTSNLLGVLLARVRSEVRCKVRVHGGVMGSGEVLVDGLLPPTCSLEETSIYPPPISPSIELRKLRKELAEALQEQQLAERKKPLTSLRMLVDIAPGGALGELLCLEGGKVAAPRRPTPARGLEMLLQSAGETDVPERILFVTRETTQFFTLTSARINGAPVWAADGSRVFRSADGYWVIAHQGSHGKLESVLESSMPGSRLPYLDVGTWLFYDASLGWLPFTSTICQIFPAGSRVVGLEGSNRGRGGRVAQQLPDGSVSVWFDGTGGAETVSPTQIRRQGRHPALQTLRIIADDGQGAVPSCLGPPPHR